MRCDTCGIEPVAPHAHRADDARMPALHDPTAEAYRTIAIADYMRWLSARFIANDTYEMALDVFEQRWPDSVHRDALRRGVVRHKAAVAAGSTTDPAWAAPLVPALSEPFIALVHSLSLLGRIPFRRVPFSLAPAVQTSAGSYYWTSQGGRKPVTKFSFAGGAAIPPTKAAGIIVITEELARVSTPGSETALRDALSAGLVAFLDGQLLDPAVAAVADKNPASLTNTIAAVATGADLDATVSAVLGALFTARPNATGAVLITSPLNASKLAGTGKNQNARADGGTVQGVALAPSSAAGANIIAIDPAGVLLAEDPLTVDVSREALVEMDGAPVGGAAAVQTSAWELNLAAFKAEQRVHWRALTGAVQWAVAP
jgi:hypothetical protein